MGSVTRLFFILFVFTLVATAQALETVPLLRQSSGQVPLLSLHNNDLFLGENSSGQGVIHRYQSTPTGYRAIQVWPVGNFLILNFSISPSGWVASCSETGNSLRYFHLKSKAAGSINFHDDGRSCAGLELIDGKLPSFLYGSVGTHEIIYSDHRGKILRTYPKISGPFHFKQVGSILFSVNGSIFKSAQRPFIMDLNTGGTLAGDSMGEPKKTGLIGGYFSRMFDDSAHTGRVYYLNGYTDEILSFDAKSPSETNTVVTRTSVLMPRSMARFGTCVAVMGVIPRQNQALETRFSVLKSNAEGKLEEVKVTEGDASGNLEYGVHFVVNALGEGLVSQSNGVVIVRGIFDDLDCRPLRAAVSF